MTRFLVFGALALAAVACGPEGEDKGDAGDGGDAGVANASAAVKECRAEAERVSAHCGDADRACLFAKYAEQCNDERAEAITESLRCFDRPVCHTFGDPGERVVGECLLASYRKHPTAAADEARKAYCSLCECPSDGAEGIPFTHFDDATNARLTGCLGKGKTCADAERCRAAEVPQVEACFTPR